MRYGVFVTSALLMSSACNRTEPPQPPSAVAPAVAPSSAPPPTPPPAALPPAAQPPKPVTFTVAAGRSLKIRTAAAISTKTARPGDRFQGVLTEAITANGVVVAPQGATVSGVVATSNPGGRVKGVAGLAVRLTRLELADGRSVDIVTSVVARQAPATKKKDALKIGIGSGVGAAIGAIAGGGKGAAIGAGSGAGAGTGVVLVTRGDAAMIPSESVLTFKLRKPVSYTR